MLVCSFVCANRTRDRGCSKHPVFPAPSDFERANEDANLGQISAARTRKYVHRRMGRAKREPMPRRTDDGFATLPLTLREPSSSALCAIAHWGGRSSIPEAAMMESISRSVLDTPPSRGMTPSKRTQVSAMKANLISWGVFAAFVACAIGFGWHAALFRFDGPMGRRSSLSGSPSCCSRPIRSTAAAGKISSRPSEPWRGCIGGGRSE